MRCVLSWTQWKVWASQFLFKYWEVLTNISLFPGNLCFITFTLSIEFSAETNDGYHIILKWKQRIKGEWTLVFLKIQPTAHSLHTSWTLLKIALLGIVMETIMGKGKKGTWPIWNPHCCCLWSACCLFQPLPIYKNEISQRTYHRISILLPFFASVRFVAFFKGRIKSVLSNVIMY